MDEDTCEIFWGSGFELGCLRKSVGFVSVFVGYR